MIELKPVTKENFWDVISLEVTPMQQEFVANNAISVAQSKVEPQWQVYAAYIGQKPVGFVMYGIDVDDDGEYWLARLMVDKTEQGKGYGRQILQKALTEMVKDPGYDKIFLGVEPENKEAIALYKSVGFSFTGRICGAEHIMMVSFADVKKYIVIL